MEFTFNKEERGHHALPNHKGVDFVNPSIYHSFVVKLNYAMAATKPDLTFAISLLDRFAANPSNNH
jgi:hypothetical protein